MLASLGAFKLEAELIVDTDDPNCRLTSTDPRFYNASVLTSSIAVTVRGTSSPD